MEWLQNALGGENGAPLQLVLITLALVVCLVLIVWVVRRIAGSPTRRAGRGRIPRLSITDSAAVDDKRYIVLVRRDNVEHLVLIGGPTDVVIESGIVRVQPVAAPAEKTSAAQSDAPKNISSSEPETTEPSISTPAAAAAASVGAAAATGLATAAEKASDALDATSQAAEDVVESIIPEAEMAVEPDVTDAIDTPELDTADIAPDLEDSITQKLDDVLSSEDFSIELDESTGSTSTETNEGAENSEVQDSDENSDDEMQRLLKELAGDSKQSA